VSRSKLYEALIQHAPCSGSEWAREQRRLFFLCRVIEALLPGDTPIEMVLVALKAQDELERTNERKP
jgi:hypothetical protein